MAHETPEKSATLNVLRIAAFSDGDAGGNPAGVAILDAMPKAARMQKVAVEVGFSETAFAAPEGEGWRVRYFSPESEVPFCGHATIALGAALAKKKGDGAFPLYLNDAAISVEGSRDDGRFLGALQSPPTWSKPASPALVAKALSAFGYAENDLDARIPPAIIHGGATHLIFALIDRRKLASMFYDLSAGRDLMNEEGLVTIAFVYAETPQLFHARNAFVSGGVYEDPATGAAAAALAGYLSDLDWPHGGAIDIVQGEDMGARSLIHAEIPEAKGASIRVSGAARLMAP